MIKQFFSYFLIVIGLLFCSDPSSKNDLDPPAPLKMVEKTAQSDTTLNESGIDAVHGLDDAISVVWHPYDGLNRVKKFKIYRSSEPAGDKNYNPYDEIDIENNFTQDTTFTDYNVTLDQFHYYFVTVVDEDNQESFPSDTAKYFLIEKARPTEPNGLFYSPGDTIQFRFIIPEETYANGYILRIERQIGENNIDLVYIEYVNPRLDFGVEDVTREIYIDSFETLSIPVEYRWRVDVIACYIRSEGSESNWAYFTVNWGD